ncbi:hypothetical protein DIPPA_13780 [Diplonema papillatum]|nr:hypothetical protein DIPPA_13780 [Diplonema papillatum]
MSPDLLESEAAREVVADENERSTASYIILYFVVLNVAYVMSKVLRALARCWKDRSMANRGGTMAILAINAAVLVGKVFFTFGKRYIFTYFAWCWVANVSSVLLLMLLLSNVVGAKSKKSVLRHSAGFFAFLLGAYGTVLYAGTKKQMGAFCTLENPYPSVMSALPVLYVITFGFLVYVKRNGYWILGEADDQLRIGHAVFQRQVDLFFSSQRKVFLLQLVMFVLGKLATHHSRVLIGCADDGNRWQFLGIPATVFGMAHTLTVMMQTKACESVISAGLGPKKID